MKKQLFIFLGIAFLLMVLSCQKDDICPPEFETTPHLIIEFYDHEKDSTLLAVENLIVIATGMEEPVVGPTTTSSVSIPLRTDQDFTEYHFITEDNGDTIREDILRFYYDPETEYLNRACGFKINFLNLKVDQVGPGDTWIRSYNILTENIQNEATTHIFFTH